ncbi:MAG: hypothetical protein JWO17_1914 [Actinomycetia bacterium]|nr:hypothetical protein [Actinomycetes bacterium]
MTNVPRLRRELVIGALFLFAGIAATLAIAAGGQSPFRAQTKVLAVSCHAGFVAESDSAGHCVRAGSVEGPIESFTLAEQRATKQTAPFQTVHPGAFAAAMAARAKKAKSGGSWSAIGNSPLYANSPDYAGSDPVNSGPSRLGWVGLSGRITAFASDPANANRIFAAPATGGVWESTAGGTGWRDIGSKIPSQAMGGLAFSSSNGGTIIAGTGDNAVGGIFTPSGLGVYTSRNDGGSWVKSVGVPDGLTTYKIAVDPTNADVSYVATSKGLFRSTDDGANYVNVALPTGACAGDTSDNAQCTFANTVSDVAVQAGSGAVIAVVGWAYGQAKTKAGIVMSPQNGIYTSTTGAPGSFTFVNPGSSAPTTNGFAPTPVVGRTTLAIANGNGQNHDVVYALVQDATKIANCLDPSLDVPVCTGTGNEVLAQATYLDGMYESSDFGQTWTKVMTHEQLRVPGNNSALQLGILGYGPGIQSWYNNWIAVDPTATDPLTKFPTRIVFGLEEIWENALPTPVTAPTQWKVIGRYWNACLLVVSGTNCSGGNPQPGTTTHPDQHAGLFVPDGVGGVTLYAGNDGGAYKQHLQAGQDFSNDKWGDGLNTGLNTLQPYDAQMAKDGTVVAGLQDNGEMKISPNGREDMVFGGDGFYTGIDPNNSQRIVEEYANGAVSGTVDGGKNWQSFNPGLTSPQFATPLTLDPKNADHLQVAGREVVQTPWPYSVHCYPDPTIPYAVCQAFDNWTTVFDLGTEPVLNKNRSSTAADLYGDYGYAGYCGPCSVRSTAMFRSGLATNVGGSAPAKFLTSDGWHLAAAKGLPQRFITSIWIDRNDPTGKTVYVTLGGYSSHWIPPGATGEETLGVGTGHVFVSKDAGETFTDVSGDLPDAPADAVIPVAGKLVAGTDVGAFVSGDGGKTWSILGDLPAMPVVNFELDPSNAKRVVAATYGRGVWAYTFT